MSLSSPPPHPPRAPWRATVLFSAALLLLAVLSFWPVGRLGYIGYDDYDYVYQNPRVRSGLSFDSLLWAVAAPHAGNWHPLTWLSLMLDCQLFGLNPGAEHWVNLGFHAASTLLLFLLLQQLTRARWRSFFVAALFACHPLHVQSVAWISERKDVLSACFALLTLLAYTRYCRCPDRRAYALVLLLLAFGLMAKPMLVTLPLVMLWLDFWPLRRAGLSPATLTAWRPLFIEKIPLFALCLASALAAFWSEHSGGSLVSLQETTWTDRCLNALVAYPQYLWKLFWPARLAILYPLPRAQPPLGAWLGALLLLLLLPALGWWRRRSQPYWLVGWLWFFVMVLPVSGIVQVGLQSVADRYTYLPSIGLFLLVVWGLAELAGIAPGEAEARPPAAPPGGASSRPSMALPAGALAGVGALVLAACVIDTRHQLGFWRNNITLFQHVVDVTPENDEMGWFYLGISYGEIGNLPAAEKCLATALQASPKFALAQSRLGNVLLLEKKYAAAETCLRDLIAAHPDTGAAHVSLGLALAGQHQYTTAQAEFATAQELLPNDPGVNQLLAANAAKITATETLAGLLPQLATNATPALHLQVAELQNQLGDYPAAVRHDEAALAREGTNVNGLNNLAWLLATCPDATVRNGPRAVQLAEHACQLSGYQATVFLGTLAAAQAEAGRFDDAIATAQKACATATAHQEADRLVANQSLLALYQHHQPYHEPDR